MSSIQSIAVVGTGNVASFLARLFYSNGIEIKGIWGRNSTAANLLATACNSRVFDSLQSLSSSGADLILIAVNDDAISNLATEINSNALVVHTSGFVGLDSISKTQTRAGVFYPLQTISELSQIEAKNVPILIESSQPADATLLYDLAIRCQLPAFMMPSAQRRATHLAAVFVNNFSNHMAFIAEQILSDQSIDFDVLKPLIAETAAKLQYLNAKAAQTGPARRNDVQTMHTHFQLLQHHPQWAELYQKISASILSSAE